MIGWQQKLRKWFVPEPARSARPKLVAPGLYAFQRSRDGEYVRYHLRVDPSGDAILLVAASEAVRLSATGALIAKRLLEGESPQRVEAEIGGPYAQHLVGVVTKLLDEIGRPSARYPIFNLADPLAGGPAAQLMAPLQADVELEEETPVQEMLVRLWEAGVPHVRFLSGSALSIENATAAVVAAEDLGMIAGIRAPAAWWGDEERIKQLAQAGLDYGVVPFLPDAADHAAVFGLDDQQRFAEIVQTIQRWEMTPVLEMALMRDGIERFERKLPKLLEWNIAHLEVFALVTESIATDLVADDSETPPSPDSANVPQAPVQLKPVVAGASRFAPFWPGALRQVAAWTEELADSQPLQVVWLPPVQCRPDDDLADVVRCGPRAGGDLSVRIAADGQVFAPRGPLVAAGNVLREAWDTIWNHEVFSRYRDRVESVTRCDVCPGLAVCAVDCPADARGWSLR